MGFGMDHRDGGCPSREGYPFKVESLKMADRLFNILYGLWAAPSRGSPNGRNHMDMELEEGNGFFQVHHRNAESINTIPRPYAVALNDLKWQVHTDASSPVSEFNIIIDVIPRRPFDGLISNDSLYLKDTAGVIYGTFKSHPRHILENGA